VLNLELRRPEAARGQVSEYLPTPLEYRFRQRRPTAFDQGDERFASLPGSKYSLGGGVAHDIAVLRDKSEIESIIIESELRVKSLCHETAIESIALDYGFVVHTDTLCNLYRV
jgi:hypothetical protein